MTFMYIGIIMYSGEMFVMLLWVDIDNGQAERYAWSQRESNPWPLES